MQHGRRDETRGERNARWVEKYCLYPNGPDKGKRVMLTPAQRDVIYAIYDPNGPQQLSVTGPLAAYWHCCMSVAPKESNQTSNRMRAPTFSRSGVRSVLNFAGCSNLTAGPSSAPR